MIVNAYPLGRPVPCQSSQDLAGDDEMTTHGGNQGRRADDHQTVRRRSRALASTTLAVAVGLLGACGSSGDDLTDLERRGREVAIVKGCMSCHGDDGVGDVGPAWTGLSGSSVELVDGRVVVADDEYLRRSITDPGADVVDGYTLLMPENDLTDGEVSAVVAYIRGR